jgi:hypothetical protein
LNAQELISAVTKAQNDPALNPIVVRAITEYLIFYWGEDPELTIRPYNLGTALGEFFVDLSQHRLFEKFPHQVFADESTLLDVFGGSSGNLSRFWAQCLEIWNVALKSDPAFASDVKQYFALLLQSSQQNAGTRATIYYPEQTVLHPGSEPSNVNDNQSQSSVKEFSNSTPTNTEFPASIPPSSIRRSETSENRISNPFSAPETKTIADQKLAYLILQGTRIIPLNQTFIKIGRQLDNHIILEDPRVSRTHAQIKLINDHYVIFDMHSTGGTHINGRQVEQSVLYPGDVIGI